MASNSDEDGLTGFFQRVAQVARDYTSTPPLPPMPKSPPVSRVLKNQSLDLFHPYGGPDTVAQIGGIVNAETEGMRDSKTENEPLAKAREKIAHVRLNGIRKYGDKVQRARSMDPPKMDGPDFQDSIEAARQAVRDQFAGVDPTQGATGYNMRTGAESLRGGPRRGDQPTTKSGPYISPTQYTWIWTYE